MYSLLLAIIYLAFISLGLPDSLLGSGWPSMHLELDVDISLMGVLTMIISLGTIISSLFSARLIKKFGTGLVSALSVTLTALAMFGFNIANSFWQLVLLAVPYGIGAGAIDSALNNYVALNYSSKHMSWLHCFWGVGTIISPYIMTYALTSTLGWSGGYKIVSIIQLVLSVVLFAALPLWNKTKVKQEEKEDKKLLTLKDTLKIKGVPFVLFTFFCYCALEGTSMIWASTYFVEYHKINEVLAASYGALFYLGLTGGRFISGFITEKIGDKNMIRIGICIILVGILMLLLPLNTYVLGVVGYILIGLGCAPIYPAIIHSTPVNFGKTTSQYVIGIEMASAYIGTTVIPPLFGLVAQYINIGLLPLFLLIFLVMLIVFSELLNMNIKLKREE